MIALGKEYAGLFADNEELAGQILAAANAEGEPAWRMPLNDAYDKLIDSNAADMKNISGGRDAGSSVGAHFIGRFTNKVPGRISTSRASSGRRRRSRSPPRARRATACAF